MPTDRKPSSGDSPGLTRRRLLLTTAVAAAGVAGGWLTLRALRPSAGGSPATATGPRPIVGPPQGADPTLVRFGQLYLGRNADERSRARLLELLGLDEDPGAALEAAAAAIAPRVRQDVEQDRFVLLDGWLITRSEARLLALAAAA